MRVVLSLLLFGLAVGCAEDLPPSGPPEDTRDTPKASNCGAACNRIKAACPELGGEGDACSMMCTSSGGATDGITACYGEAADCDEVRACLGDSAPIPAGTQKELGNCPDYCTVLKELCPRDYDGRFPNDQACTRRCEMVLEGVSDSLLMCYSRDNMTCAGVSLCPTS